MDGLNSSVITGKCSGCTAYRGKLKEAREKLAPVEGENKRLREALVAYAPMGKALLDRILKGGAGG